MSEARSDTGEESPNGAPRKMHAFCGVPGLEGENQDNPRDEQPIRSVFEHDEQPIQSVPKQAAHSERVPPEAGCRSNQLN